MNEKNCGFKINSEQPTLEDAVAYLRLIEIRDSEKNINVQKVEMYKSVDKETKQEEVIIKVFSKI